MSKKPITVDEAYNRVASQCVLREYCRADWFRKLLNAGLTQQEVESVLDRLKDDKFIDEERYCRSFVHDKLLYDRWGRIKIRYSLRQKAIADEFIEAALATIDETEYMDILQDVIRQKKRSVKADSDYELRQKLARFAAGRGFEPGTVFKLLDLNDE